MDRLFKVHPCYNLNIADTYRSSANDPNIQNVFKHNVFKHDPELKRFRRCIVPSAGRIILEVDYSGLEVRVIAMASGDVELIRQICEGVDTHRRWASEIYQKPQEEISKDERFQGKNSFVFASFYGAVPDSIARNFPNVPDGHIAKVQEKFWSEFHGVKSWQEQTVRIEIELERRGLQSRPIFEIHDSIAIDTVPAEAEEVVELVTEIMVSKRFDWQGDVPLAVEWEVGYPSWYDLAPLNTDNGRLAVEVEEDGEISLIDLKEYIAIAA